MPDGPGQLGGAKHRHFGGYGWPWAALCVAYMIKQMRWPLSVAIQHAFLARPMILSNEGFLLQLVALAREEGLLEGSKSPPFGQHGAD